MPPQHIIVQGSSSYSIILQLGTVHILAYLKMEDIKKGGIELSKSEKKKLLKSNMSLSDKQSENLNRQQF